MKDKGLNGFDFFVVFLLARKNIKGGRGILCPPILRRGDV